MTEARAATDASPPSITSQVDESFSKPRPRAPRSPAQAAQVRKTNRRQEFLERHPSYFDSLEHELADPILYDKLIRRFQTAQEREKEGKTKGYSRVLEVDLLRGEAKLSQLAAEGNGERNESSHTPSDSFSLGLRTPTAEPETKEEGRERWNSFLRERFTSGQDEDFDYDTVDADDSLDVLERRDEEEAWFNDEAPGWASDGKDEFTTDRKQLQGETGIQDF
ncbi:hypothetical protein PFICI_02914 [Pestalotiopsis fici W106-1]|uniref:CCD97-like C-terminal domain-containing protein n=1 Tax=Pestalotiopsis fici (strain W106-1 / CGMCC3.15140) TaxID=1229662 RepID=W3XFV4_PESFW|nr:uncharacterized protein PFICI_02914 [Pestalotiopsis fici W106-1]ETS84889.1 hypothetical protein PFICI_02914 [Pestalotiopsis fici W106-1]